MTIAISVPASVRIKLIKKLEEEIKQHESWIEYNQNQICDYKLKLISLKEMHAALVKEAGIAK